MTKSTPAEKKELDRNKASDMKNQKAGAPWGLKVNKKRGTSDGHMVSPKY